METVGRLIKIKCAFIVMREKIKLMDKLYIEDRGEIIIGFTCGAMDLLHPGHLRMLKECSEQCDYLVVGLQIDPSIDRPEKHSPIETADERKERLKACRYVDAIVEYGTEAELPATIQFVAPDVRFVGADWWGKDFTGKELPIKVVFNSRNHNYSSSALIDRIIKKYGKKICPSS